MTINIVRMILLAAVFVVFGFGTALHADATLRFSDARTGSESTVLIKGASVRMEEREADGSMIYSLFDRDERTLIMVMDEERAYAVLTEDGLKAQADQLRDMQQEFLVQMRQQMQYMPPDQQQMMQQQMMQLGIDPAMLSGEDTPTPDISSLETRSTGRTRTLGAYDCREIEVWLEGELTNELCLADAAQVGMSRADFETLQVLFTFMHSLSEIAMSMGGPFAAEMGAEMLPEMDGVPVMVKNPKDGSEVLLRSVSRENLPAKLFRIPDDYQAVDPF
jgi:hypothetical protein